MKPRDDNDKSQGSPKYSGPPAGLEQGEMGGDEDPLAYGSPRNLVPIAMTVLLLIFAAVVFFLAAELPDVADRDKWGIAGNVISYVASGISWAGILVGLGTLATARPKDARSVESVARLLSFAGALVVVLGVAGSVCLVGRNDWDGWRNQASQIAYLLAYRVFDGGVLAGLALLCLRQARMTRQQGQKRPRQES